MNEEKIIQVVPLDQEVILNYLNSKEFEDAVMATLKEIADKK